MRIERVFTEGLAQIAYLVGDDEAGVAAVIDPRRDARVYVEMAKSLGLEIVAALETHVHADFVSGARELHRLTNAPIYAGSLSEQAFPHVSLDSGDTVEVGKLRLRALGTPGHTPEHVSYLLFDSADAEPTALFSGDMLFVGEVGRPDLLGEGSTHRLVGQLYDSIFKHLMPLPDSLAVWPGHGAGSSCGGSIGSAPSTTLGQEKRSNYAFQPRSLDEFEQVILSALPPVPTYYPHLKRVNRVGPELLDRLAPGEPLSPEAVARHQSSGALVIDARDPVAFAAGHLPGSISVGLGPNFLPWIGWLAPYERDIVLVLERDEQFAAARDELRLIGVDRIAGYLHGGVDAWLREGHDLATLPTLTVAGLYERLKAGEPVSVLDVRSQGEWEEGHVARAEHCFAGLIAQSVTGIPDDGPRAVICGSGYRSSLVASLLLAHGHTETANVLGGMSAWTASGYPVVE